MHNTGNGSQEVFIDSNSVLTISIHRWLQNFRCWLTCFGRLFNDFIAQICEYKIYIALSMEYFYIHIKLADMIPMPKTPPATQRLLREDLTELELAEERDSMWTSPSAALRSVRDFISTMRLLWSIITSWVMKLYKNTKVMGDPEYMAVFYSLVLPILEDYKPNYIFVSAGENKDT